MNCTVVTQMLSAFIDHEVSASDESTVHGHLDNCASCRRQMEMLRQTAGTLSALPEIEPPAFLLQQIMTATVAKPTFAEKLSAAFTPAVKTPQYLRWAGAGAAAAIALIALMLSQPATRQIAINPPTPEHRQPAAPSQVKPTIAVGNVASANVPLNVVVTKSKPSFRAHRTHRPAAVVMAKVVQRRLVAANLVGPWTPGTEDLTPKVDASADVENMDSAVAAEPDVKPAAPVTVASNAVSDEDVAKQARLAKVAAIEKELAQEPSATEQLRARIAARNRTRAYMDSDADMVVDVKKASVQLATIRF
jgi:hypothetical protein